MSKKHLQAIGQDKGMGAIGILMIIGILGALAGLAVPKLQKYQAQAKDASAQAVLKIGISMQEAHFVQHDEYITCEDEECEELLEGFKLTKGVSVQFGTGNEGKGLWGLAAHKNGATCFEQYNWEPNDVGAEADYMYAEEGYCWEE